MITTLLQALEADHALYFDIERVVIRNKGWAWQYADSFVAISESYDTLELFRTPCSIEEYDYKDLIIIARKVGYTVESSDTCIVFLPPGYDDLDW